MVFPKENKLENWLKNEKQKNIIKYTITGIVVKIKLILINIKYGRYY